MKKILIIFIFLVLLPHPVEAKREDRYEDLRRRIIERLPEAPPAPTNTPTSIPAPTPTPKSAILLPNDSEVHSFLNEDTDNAVSSEEATIAAKITPRSLKIKSSGQSDQTTSIIASFLTFIAVAWASYQGLFDRGFFKRL